jgi:hydrogenase maturation protein HypF
LSDGIGGRWAGDTAIAEAVARLAAGQIVALRGLGGYQLLVDATNERAVVRLRNHKGRWGKPLAVMVESLVAAERLAHFDDEERSAFNDVSAPIVLVRAKTACGLAMGINPHLDTVGLMRPTTPLHALIATAFGRPLVCTSGNREGDPLEYEIEPAEKRLAGIADVWLHHDRPIVRPIDDSVVRVIAGRRVTIRLARGLAPLSLALPPMAPTLAVGGYLKSAAAWSNSVQAVLGPHIGDQETVPSRERFVVQLHDWQELYRLRPGRIVHDVHPDYFSTHWAERQSLPKLAVQHHHAHIVAGMLEHGWLDRQVIGVAWDGTGYGTDGTIWGGEFLICTAAKFERVARLRQFRLPGGEAAIHEPWRTAVAVCEQLAEPRWLGYIADPSRIGEKLESVRQILSRPHLSPLTSSAGRLFDAAAAVILGIERVDYDGQAAMRLEAIADVEATGHYDLPFDDNSPRELDWRPMFAQLLADVRDGVAPARMAMRFHRGLALAIAGVCRLHSPLPIVLSGGVFQNRLLTELVAELLADGSQPLGLPGVIPPNDGGLAAGQLAIAAAREGLSPCV